MTVFSDHATKAEITYYTNEKENAIAPRVTAEGATELQDEIDETFTKTVANIALSTTSSLTDFLNGDNFMNYASLLLHELDNAVEDLDAAQLEVKGLSSMVGDSATLLAGSSTLLGNTKNATNTTNELLSEASNGLSSADEALGNITDEVNGAITSNANSPDPAATEQLLGSISGSLASTKTLYEQM